MAYRVDLTDRAKRDLRRLYQTINAADSAVARARFIGLEHAILGLDEHPARNPLIPENTAQRHLLYGRWRNVYRIIYEINDPARVVTVLHIRHGAPMRLFRVKTNDRPLLAKPCVKEPCAVFVCCEFEDFCTERAAPFHASLVGVGSKQDGGGCNAIC